MTMKIKRLLSEDDAVSPVIGVILMVAITVILAAVIGSFVLNLGGSLNDTAPQASFGFEYDDSGTDALVNITHQSGDTIESARLNVTSSSGSSLTEDAGWSGTVAAGDTATYNKSGSDWNGETVRVVWESETGESSATLSTSTAPS